MWWNEYWHGPWMFFGPLMMFALIAICMALMYFAMRGRGSERGRAMEILQERYARGEINQEEFQERREHLES
jgi:putative membrane protein